MAFDRIEESGARLGRWSLRPRPASTTLAATTSITELAYVDLPTEVELLESLKTTTDRYMRERLERRLWALLRVMAKKGLLTREEFLAEFDE